MRIRRLNKGDSPVKGPLSARQWNGVADAASAVHALSARGMMTGGGVLTGARGGRPSRVVIGVIDSNGKTDFDDNRYWVKVFTNKGGAALKAPDATSHAVVQKSAAESLQLAATNLAESDPADIEAAGSHLLDDETSVLLFQVSIDSRTLWVFWRVPDTEFPAEITGDTGRAHSWKEREASSDSGDGDKSGGRTGNANAYDVNWREGVPSGTQVRMRIEWDYTNQERRYRFDIAAGDDQEDGAGANRNEDAAYMGEHAESALMDTGWDVENQGTERGVKLSVITGVSYYHAGDETLYAYKRDLEFDANGNLMSFSAESRVTVDVPETEDCG